MSEIKYAESCNTCREMTIKEEILALDISEDTKKRIINKVEFLEKDYKQQGEYLTNCHIRIKSLERALVETTCSMSADIYTDIYNLLTNR